jgi:hypothetical protein
MVDARLPAQVESVTDILAVSALGVVRVVEWLCQWAADRRLSADVVVRVSQLGIDWFHALLAADTPAIRAFAPTRSAVWGGVRRLGATFIANNAQVCTDGWCVM